MKDEVRQYILDMYELNELISQDTILSDIIEEARLDTKAFGRKLKTFDCDFNDFINSNNKTRQDFDKVLKEQKESLDEIHSYGELYHSFYADGKNNDNDKVEDDLIIARLTAYENVLHIHMRKLKEISETEGFNLV